MEQMRGSDWQHLYDESEREPRHTLKIAVLDPTEAGRTLDLDDVRRFAERLTGLTPMRWVPVEAPGRMAPPAWVDRGRPDLDRHLAEQRLPEPTDAAFDAAMGALLEGVLPRDRPLWRLNLVHGLRDGRVAVALQMHHALADGGASARLLGAAFDDALEPYDGPAEPWPDRRSQWERTVRFRAASIARVPNDLARSAKAGVGERLRWRRGADKPDTQFGCEATLFNARPTPARRYVDLTVSLSDIKTVKDRHDTSVNDVFVSIVGGGVRRFLQAHDALPDTDLITDVPVSVRGADDDRIYGNVLNDWVVSLATTVEDPVERLRRVSRSAAAARARLEATDGMLRYDWMNRYRLHRLASRVLVEKMTERDKPVLNMVVSNVRGPTKPLNFEGIPVVGIRSASVLTNFSSLNVTAWSYLDDFAIGIVTCPDHVPDTEQLAGGIRDELDALLAAG